MATAFDKWFLYYAKATPQAVANVLENGKPATSALSLPDFDEWAYDDYWSCSQYITWFSAMESKWGTDAAALRFAGCWKEKPTGFNLLDENVCGKQKDFVDFFANKGIDVANPLYSFQNIVKSLNEKATTVGSFAFSSFGLYLGASALGIYGLYRLAGTYYDVQLERPELKVKQNTLIKGLAVMAVAYPAYRLYARKNVDVLDGEQKGLSYCKIHLVEWALKIKNFYHDSSKNLIMWDKTIYARVEEYATVNNLDLDAVMKAEFESVKHFLLLNNGKTYYE